jgi:hypothetical protein
MTMSPQSLNGVRSRRIGALALPGRGPAINGRGATRWHLRLLARLGGSWIDTNLAAGTPSWHSPLYVTRSLRLTSDRHRRDLARSLDRLIEHAERPPGRFMTATLPPVREQVREAMPLILEIASRLRSGEPIEARGIALLTTLLSDGAGPCYTPARPGALATALQALPRALDVQD